MKQFWKRVGQNLRSMVDPLYFTDDWKAETFAMLDRRAVLKERMKELGFTIEMKPLWVWTICRIFRDGELIVECGSPDELEKYMIRIIKQSGIDLHRRVQKEISIALATDNSNHEKIGELNREMGKFLYQGESVK